jgi:fluoride exporter
MNLVVLSLAGSVGAVCRYLVSGSVQTRHRSDFPIGTLTVNLAGSFGLGLVVGYGALESTLTMALVGFLGGFTTFSTWMIETLGLRVSSPRALLNLTSSLAGGLFAAGVGFILTN